PECGHHRREPLRRHPLQLLQPDPGVAAGRRLLPQEGRRHLPGRAEQPVLLAGTDQERELPVSALYRDDGIDYLAKQAWEVITALRLPPADGLRTAYVKLRRRGSIDFPIAGCA